MSTRTTARAAWILIAGCFVALTANSPSPARAEHALDPVLKIAYEVRDHLNDNVRDYTARLIKRQRIDGKLTEHNFMQVKIRNRQEQNGKVVAPFSIYLKFDKPSAGREVIWVENRNDGNLVAHEGGFINVLRFNLDPKGSLAMKGNKYPIYDIGTSNLIDKLIVRAEAEREAGITSEVVIRENAKVGDRMCRLVQVRHAKRQPGVEYHLSRIYIDRETNIPVRFAAFGWPRANSKDLPVEEEYTYVDMQVNVGLTDRDFDPDNSKYNYP